MMVTTPESMPEIPIDFRAPPPSPIASGRRSTVTNDDILTEFLQTSLRVPDLVLPDKIFPKQKHIESPSKLDFQILSSAEDHGVSTDGEMLLPADIVDSIARIGCFELVNHGISREVTRFMLAAAAGIFQLSPEKKAVARRSQEKPYGFEEDHGDQEVGSEVISEEFVWCRDEGLKLEMEGIWPEGYPKFSNKMETFLSDIEKIAEKILQAVSKSFPRKSTFGNDDGIPCQDDQLGTVCCLYKHSPDNSTDGWSDSLKYEVITMLIKGADHSHSLCLHVCDGSSEFHVYSKKGWISFVPDEHALIITVGDQLQALSGGHYKHVIGRPIFKGEAESCISMAFLYSPKSTSNKEHSFETNKQEKSISLCQQAMLAIILTLVYRCLVYIYNNI